MKYGAFLCVLVLVASTHAFPKHAQSHSHARSIDAMKTHGVATRSHHQQRILGGLLNTVLGLVGGLLSPVLGLLGLGPPANGQANILQQLELLLVLDQLGQILGLNLGGDGNKPEDNGGTSTENPEGNGGGDSSEPPSENSEAPPAEDPPAEDPPAEEGVPEAANMMMNKAARI